LLGDRLQDRNRLSLNRRNWNYGYWTGSRTWGHSRAKNRRSKAKHSSATENVFHDCLPLRMMIRTINLRCGR
jgi:hypothetical protein